VCTAEAPIAYPYACVRLCGRGSFAREMYVREKERVRMREILHRDAWAARDSG